jgi:hypothetical protein
MVDSLVCARAEEAEQELDEGREEGVDAEEEERQQAGHDHHHDRGGDRFLTGRPMDLGGLGTNLTDEFAGRSLGHDARRLGLRIEKRPADLTGRRG